MSFAPGENVGPYRIIEQLGQGGMATVYKGYHAGLDRYVAIKALHPAFKQDPNFIGRFEREARIVAKLDHPNIIPVYDFAEHDGTPYIVIRYVEGITLKPALHNGILPLDRVLSIIRPVTDALAYAHAQGVLHRDIKPSNIMLANDGHIYLTDFGLARMANVSGSTLSQDMIVGTPQYISPEQAKGDPLDARSDLYSLGVVLYEMLTGRVPFSADTPYAIIHDHIFTPLPLPRTINPELSPDIERVLLKALAKDPAERFFSAAELMAALENPKRISSILARRPQPAKPQAARPASRLLVVGAVIGLMLVLLIGLFVFNRARRPPQGIASSGQSPVPTIASTLSAPVSLPSPSVIPISNIVPSATTGAVITATLPPTVLRSATMPAPTVTLPPATSTLANTPTRLASATRTLAPTLAPTLLPTPTVFVTAPKTTGTVPNMVLVPAGAFWMGKRDGDPGAAVDESPGHYVELSAYYIDQREVSNAEYRECVNAGNCPLPTGVYSPQSPQLAFGNPAFDDFPVVFVSQGNASEYCVWVGKRLPTEAEWEKAARGAEDARLYPWGDTWDGYRANAAQGKPGPLSVQSYIPNGCSPFGACNMAGNVAEWVADFYQNNYYADSQRGVPGGTLVRDPINWNTSSGKLVVRGGSFRSTTYDARVSKRGNRSGDTTVDEIGFRCALSAK